MREGRDGRSARTLRRDELILRPLLASIGGIPLHALRTHDVRRALSELATSRSSATVALTHNCLVRAIRHAESGDHVRRNVAALVKPPPGKGGRPSRAMTVYQAAALLRAAGEDGYLGPYVILSLTTGIRTEEARALRWDHVDLDGDPGAGVPPPASTTSEGTATIPQSQARTTPREAPGLGIGGVKHQVAQSTIK
jgi:integrase